jgi:hypothetical protein
MHFEICCNQGPSGGRQASGHDGRMSEAVRASEREVTRTADMHNGSRLAAVSRALDGRWVNAGDLGYDLTYNHIAVVADASSPLYPLARHTQRQLLQVEAPGGGVWGWLGGRTLISKGELDGLIAWQRSREGQVAFGEPAPGIAGFSASHHQALEARTIAVATGQRTVRFADLCVLIAVLRDVHLAKAFIARELGDLDRPSERMRELRATLRAYLEQGQCVSAAAALRRRDRKTIQRQLRSAERLLDRCVRDRSDELLIALRTADILRRAG